MLKRQYDIGRKTWVTKVREILFQYGFGYVWLWQEVGDINTFNMQFKLRLIYCMTQGWHDTVNSSSRCDLYKHVKSLLNPEKYLSINLSHKFHVFFICPRFSTVRNQFLFSWYTGRSDLHAFYRLLKSDNSFVIR